MLLTANPALAEWTTCSTTLNESNLSHIAIDQRSPGTLFAAGDRAVYKTEDKAQSWKKVLTVTGQNSRIHSVYVDPVENQNVYVSSSKGLYHSEDFGKHWRLIFKGRLKDKEAVYTVARRPAGPPSLWIASANGLFRQDIHTREIIKAEGIPAISIYSVVFPKEDTIEIILATDKGIYKSPDGAGRWERVDASVRASEEDENKTKLEQFDIEEFYTTPAFSNMVYWRAQDKFLAASSNGLLEAKQDAASWTPVKGENLPDKKINSVAGASQTYYVATDRGVFKRDPLSEKFIPVSEGLGSQQVREIVYDERNDRLLAATAKGLYRWQAPEYLVISPSVPELKTPHPDEVLRRFSFEPSIAEVQNAAIQYAEVHPDKINQWRAAAAKKAFLPTLSAHTAATTDQNVDIDRGGTADPDKFIMGPKEKSLDWNVTASWDLGNLIWNDDQTSIDTRSRLMVELRDDILSEVTHFYYERRRLQVEMALSPAHDLPLQIEKEIRLSELTANIDGLTGGYFSKRLAASGN